MYSVHPNALDPKMLLSCKFEYLCNFASEYEKHHLVYLHIDNPNIKEIGCLICLSVSSSRSLKWLNLFNKKIDFVKIKCIELSSQNPCGKLQFTLAQSWLWRKDRLAYWHTQLQSSCTTEISVWQGGMGHWDVYYSSLQRFIITFSYSFSYSYLLNIFYWIFLVGSFICNCNLQKG